MNRTRLATALLAATAAVASIGAFAQTTAATTVQRDQNQEQRIEKGLQNGRITTREDALLQRDQAHVAKLQSRDLANGSLSPAERARLNAAQGKSSRDIARATHNGVNGNPLSAPSQRAQAETQRNVDQQGRVEAGLKDGSLTRREAGHLENGEATIDRQEFRAGRDGHVGAGEATRVARADNRESARIHRQRHDAQVR